MIRKTGELAYVFGIVLCALGVTLSAKSAFGVSMVVAPAYVLHCYFVQFLPWFSFGVAEYAFQGFLILLLSLWARRFKWKYLFSVFTALFYGTCVDLWRLVFGAQIYDLLWQRLISGALGAVVTAFSIALLLRTYLPQQAYELVVKEVSEKGRFPINRVKWIYDLSSLVLAIGLMLVFFREFSFEMIGPGTLVLTLINTPLIALWGRLLDRLSDFSCAAPRLQERYLALFD